MPARACTVTGTDKCRRKHLRNKLGCLKDLLVKPATRQRYAKSFQLFVLFLHQSLGYLPTTPVDYDVWLSKYVEFLWHEGEAKAVATFTLAAVQYYVPQLRKQLPLSWKLKSTWDKIELPCQAAPMTPDILFAFTYEAWQRGWYDFACLCLLMFVGFLRTGEALSLHVRHVAHSEDGVVLTLCNTKGTQRTHQQQQEEVLLDDPVAIWASRYLSCGKLPGESLSGLSTYSFRKQWGELVSLFHLHSLKFQPYSLRRGGATHFFHVSGNMHRTLLLGRWKHLSTARLYIREARAAAQSLHLPSHARTAVHTAARLGRRLLQRQVGTHGGVMKTPSPG